MLKDIGIKKWFSCDYIYYYENPIQEYIQNSSIESIVLLKESFKSPIQHEGWRILIEKEYTKVPVDKLIVYNQHMKYMLAKTNIVNKDSISVGGSPRMSLTLERLKTKNTKERVKKVIFFESSVKAGFPVYGKDYCVIEALQNYGITESQYACIKKEWERISLKILNDSIEYASLNPDILVVYKCKIGSNRKYSLREPAPNNWLLNDGSKGSNLYSNVAFCIGFNTSALLESIFREIPTFSPFIDTNKLPETIPFIMNYGKSIRLYKDVNELKSSKYELRGSKIGKESDVYRSLSWRSEDCAYPAIMDKSIFLETFE